MQNQIVSISNKKISEQRQAQAEARRAHVERWKSGGLSMTAYCRQHNLVLTTFSTWAKPYKKSLTKFKPISIRPPMNLAPVPQSSVIEILVDHRIKIRLLNVSDASMVLAIAKGLMSCN